MLSGFLGCPPMTSLLTGARYFVQAAIVFQGTTRHSPPMHWQIGRAFFLIGCLSLFASCETSTFDPPQRIGPPLLVTPEGEPRLWLLVKIEEQRQRRVGGGRFSIGKWVTDVYYHFDLQCHDARTTERVWQKRLLTLRDKEGGHNAQSRILGPDGEAVWLFLGDQAVALGVRDGSVLADGKAIAQRNPALQGLLPKEGSFYAFDDGLVVTSADGRRSRVRAPDYAAEPYTPASDDHFRHITFMATQWNGGYNQKDFRVHQVTLGGRWLGLYTEKEAADAGDDEWGDTLANPASIYPEGSRARRTFWTGRIGRTKEFSEGSHDRLFDITKVPGAPEYLEAGLLIKQGTKAPLMLENPVGVLVLHRTRLDAEGRLALTRLDESLREKWKATLPIIELQNRYELRDGLLLYGAIEVQDKSTRGWQEWIVALDLRDGKVQAWNVTLEKGGLEMKLHRLVLCGLLVATGALRAEPSAMGIVYGPKGAFSIKAPDGWVLDNEAGRADGLPCVLFPKEEDWETADPLMYAKIAGTDVTDAEAFAKKAIAEMTKERGEFAVKRSATGKTAGGEPYFINDYAANDDYSRSERVAYIQMPKAVAYVVFSAEKRATLAKHARALTQVLESFRAMEAKVDGESE